MRKVISSLVLGLAAISAVPVLAQNAPAGDVKLAPRAFVGAEYHDWVVRKTQKTDKYKEEHYLIGVTIDFQNRSNEDAVVGDPKYVVNVVKSGADAVLRGEEPDSVVKLGDAFLPGKYESQLFGKKPVATANGRPYFVTPAGSTGATKSQFFVIDCGPCTDQTTDNLMMEVLPLVMNKTAIILLDGTALTGKADGNGASLNETRVLQRIPVSPQSTVKVSDR